MTFPNLKLSAEALWLITHADTLTKYATYLIGLTVLNTVAIIILWNRKQ
jgi:hypothetical protein